MKNLLLACLLLFPLLLSAQEKDKATSSGPDLTNAQLFAGYFDFYWMESEGKVWLKLPESEEEFLLIHSLPAGLGSNDVGLDRGQISEGRVVSFRRVGNKVLLTESNYDYRAVSDNPAERRAVREAFAKSVLFGFEIKKAKDSTEVIDLTPFLLSDQHRIAQRLKESKQGKYEPDPARSAVYPDRFRSFPDNSEFEATLTFKGSPEGAYVRSVTPTPELITLRQHLSFVRLPDDGYQMRRHRPESGYLYIDFYDYAQPVEQPLEQRYIVRHRLEKINPNAARSEPVEPIIYYLDPGTPEPIRSALLEGAGWWNEAFEAAGYINAFQVEMLPDSADPMDVRYNLIQWVHRSTRGWSYGASVVDPRTGEIIKGHVSLGSLRVRQDFLIAQGLLALYENGNTPDPKALELALARLRQLSAHEVGHTLGLVHNFAASTQDRASVMDYPHPFILLDESGESDFSRAYDTGIGEWDIRAIGYGYIDYPDNADPEALSAAYLRETFAQDFYFITDRDARPVGSANPLGHLWDNQADLTAELDRIMDLRKQKLETFGTGTIPSDLPYFEFERVLVPLYLSHRYQTEAVAKLIGGVQYDYLRQEGDAPAVQIVPADQQERALESILATIRPEALCLPVSLMEQLAPPPPGYGRDRESFPSHTNPLFDPVAAAEASALHSLTLLLAPERLARISRQHAFGKSPWNLTDYLERITLSIFTVEKENAYQIQVAQAVESVFLEHLFRLGRAEHPDAVVAAAISWQLERIQNQLRKELELRPGPHDQWLVERIDQYRNHPDTFSPLPQPEVPPGSPIGCGH